MSDITAQVQQQPSWTSSSRWAWVVTCTPWLLYTPVRICWYALYGRLDRSRSLRGDDGKQKNLHLYWESNPDSPVTQLTACSL